PAKMLSMDSRKAAFASWLVDQMERKGVRQAELARRTGASSGLVNDWVKAKKLPEARNCIRIAEALGLHPDVVLYHAGHADKLPAPIRTYEIQHEIRQLRDLEGEQEVRLRRLEQLASQLG